MKTKLPRHEARAEPKGDLEGLRTVVRQAVRHLRASVHRRDWPTFWDTLGGLEDLVADRGVQQEEERA